MTKERDSYSYEITLRAVGQALEALGVESFELVVDGDNFVVYGGPEPTLTKQRDQAASGFRLFGRNRSNSEKILYERNATPPKRYQRSR
jgi:hypothetical protein